MDLIKPEDVVITVWPPRKIGGQQCGGGHSGVKIVHIPTGTEAISIVGRSQHTNRAIAFDMILSALTHPRMERLNKNA